MARPNRVVEPGRHLDPRQIGPEDLAPRSTAGLAKRKHYRQNSAARMNAAGAVGTDLRGRIVKIVSMDRRRICKGGKPRRSGQRRADNRAPLSA